MLAAEWQHRAVRLTLAVAAPLLLAQIASLPRERLKIGAECL
jgi:hypothetical protein